MNVDLNWCPCGRQVREDSMYCSDACYFKDLASNNNTFIRSGRPFEKDPFFTTTTTITGYNYQKYDMNNTMFAPKVPDMKSMMLTASNNLTFKNRQKYHPSYYYGGNNHHSGGHHHSSHASTLSSSYESTTSTIDDYFKTFSKLEHSPKPSEAILTSKGNDENDKEKTEMKSYSSRSSYIIEAVYPVQNFNKTTIAVY